MRNDSYSDNRRLTPEQWAELSHRVAREAHAARAQSLRTSLRALFGVLRRPGVPTGLVAAAAREWWTAYGTWLERRRAVRALGALDDRSLKDMGMHRSEIESAVLGQSSAPPPPRGWRRTFTASTSWRMTSRTKPTTPPASSCSRATQGGPRVTTGR